ncbi:hypothetical protein EDB80DRAFT_829857 [Ilyonectria destructans]|nr:hypothetical protein EDB80DRAFT_829857 [Ilyonectria destructans]
MEGAVWNIPFSMLSESFDDDNSESRRHWSRVVELTNNLLDHLEVVDIEGETTVMIFHHASFLNNQEQQLFPYGFVNETLQTLALLFPQNKLYKPSKTWYHRYLKPATMDTDLTVLTRSSFFKMQLFLQLIEVLGKVTSWTRNLSLFE